MTKATVLSPGERRKRGVRARWAMMGLRWRLTLYLGVALVVLLIAFTVLSLQAASRAQSLALSQHLHLVRTTAGSLGRQFDDISPHVLVHLPRVPSPAAMPEALASLQVHLAHFENLGYFQVSSVRLVDAQGEALAVALPGTSTSPDTLPPREVIRQAVSEGQTIVVSSRFHVQGEVPFAAVVVPLPPSPTSPKGAAVVVDTTGLAAADLFSLAEEEAPGQGGEASDGGSYGLEVLRSDSVVLATSEGQKALGTTSLHYSVLKGFMARGEAGAIVHRPGVAGQRDHIVAVVPVQGTPFFLVMEEDLGLLLDWPQQVRRQAIILGVTAALILLALGGIIGKQTAQPVAALRRAIARIKGGDLETPVRVRAQGELAQLGEEIEAMRQRLRDTVSSLDDLNRSLADQVRERTEQLRNVVARLMQAQEEERHRVARDLHDETAQGLTALGIILDELALEAGENGGNALRSIRSAREQVRWLVAETRRLAYALRPSVLDDAGLVPALRWCAEAYLEANRIQGSLDAPEPELRFPEPVEVALFRVAQEAMSNIARHAQASHAWVTLKRRGALVTLTVRDDGIGFDVRQMMQEDGPRHVQGLGLAGMRERMDLLGGQLLVASHPGDGTTVTASVSTHLWEEQKR